MTEEIIMFNKSDVESLEEAIKRLEQENRELKDNDCEKCKHLDLYMKYRSALEEIREIVNQPCNNCKYNKDDITCSIGDCGEGKLKIIETKINEVLK